MWSGNTPDSWIDSTTNSTGWGATNNIHIELDTTPVPAPIFFEISKWVMLNSESIDEQYIVSFFSLIDIVDVELKKDKEYYELDVAQAVHIFAEQLFRLRTQSSTYSNKYKVSHLLCSEPYITQIVTYLKTFLSKWKEQHELNTTFMRVWLTTFLVENVFQKIHKTDVKGASVLEAHTNNAEKKLTKRGK